MDTLEQVLDRSKMAGFGEVQSLIKIAYSLGRVSAFDDCMAMNSPK